MAEMAVAATAIITIMAMATAAAVVIVKPPDAQFVFCF
jgi:hypothetical protein